MSIVGRNLTSFFKREVLMYSLFDLRFKKPVSIRKVGYLITFLAVWGAPIFVFLFGSEINVYSLAISFVPPFFAANFATKPIFGGKSFLDFLKTQFYFMFEPRGWDDLRANNYIDGRSFFVEQEIWVSRRRELAHLVELKSQRKMVKK